MTQHPPFPTKHILGLSPALLIAGGTILLSAVFASGCTEAKPAMSLDPCTEGEVHERACGAGDTGTQGLTCTAIGEWQAGPCVLAPACTAGETRPLSCPDNTIAGEQRCQQGEWQTTRACMAALCTEGLTRSLPCDDGVHTGQETCTDGEWVLSAYCPSEACTEWATQPLNCIEGVTPGERQCLDGEWVITKPCIELGCTNGETRTLACGLNGRGNRVETCINQAWTQTQACNDPDVCKDAATQTLACIDSDLGRYTRTCTVGAWENGACIPNSIDGSTTSVRMGDENAWTTREPFACAVRNNGRVACWGSNRYGQLGQGHTNPITGVVDVMNITTAREISVGGSFACALLTNGTVSCWGDNAWGQTASATSGTTLSPTAVAGLSNVRLLSAGGDHVCAVTGASPARTYCWGKNDRHQIAPGTNLRYTAPHEIFVGSTSASTNYISAGSEHTCLAQGAYLSNGVTISPRIYCWGDNQYAQSGAVDTSYYATVTTPQTITIPSASPLTTIEGLEAGTTMTCTSARNGRLPAQTYCWGSNRYYGVAHETIDTLQPTPVQIPTITPGARVIASVYSGCLIRNSNSKAYCWGDNADGQLGQNSIAYTRSLPNASAPVYNLPAVSRLFTMGATDRSPNGEHLNFYVTNCAFTQTGAVYCWGANPNETAFAGELDTLYSSVPVRIPF